MLTGVSQTFHADVLFSALYLQGGGEQLLEQVSGGKLWFSDAFPYCGEKRYLPKPIGNWNRQLIARDSSTRKQFKKLSYISLEDLPAFLKAECKNPQELKADFGQQYEVTRVNRRDFDDPLPYQLGVFHFREDCGLYFYVTAESEAVLSSFDDRLRSCAMEGIGGKLSSGWGKFTCERLSLSAWENQALADKTAPTQILLSVSLPKEEEAKPVMDGSCYALIRRGGFSRSPVEKPHKKHTVYLFNSGSTFSQRFVGQMMDVGQNMPHPVWRYAMAGFMGVRL